MDVWRRNHCTALLGLREDDSEHTRWHVYCGRCICRVLPFVSMSPTWVSHCSQDPEGRVVKCPSSAPVG